MSTTAALRVPAGVRVLDETRVLLICRFCGQQWSPLIQPGGKLARKSKHCPNGCTQREDLASMIAALEETGDCLE